MTDNTKKGYFDENLTFDGVQKTMDDLAKQYREDAGVITTIGKLGSLMSILHDDIREQNRLTGIQTNRLERLSWIVGFFSLVSTIAAVVDIWK